MWRYSMKTIQNETYGEKTKGHQWAVGQLFMVYNMHGIAALEAQDTEKEQEKCEK